MSEQDEEKVRPAKYPDSDDDEHDAIDVLNYILASPIKSFVDSRDKAPNHDGWLELVDDDGVPTGRIVIQVKKLPDKHEDDPKIQMETRHLSYCYVTAEPFFLIVVDSKNEVAYWRHISPGWFEEEELDEQDYKTVHLPGENRILKGEEEYVNTWQGIIDSTKERIENYEEYEELKKHSNSAIGKKIPHFEHIHDFLDEYNRLLEEEFFALKSGLYPNVWKFGFASTDYSETSLHYTLYPIEADENDAQIREIDSSWEAVHNLGSNRRIGVPHDNPIQRLPEKYAFNVLEKQVSTLIERRKLDYTDCTFLATEYVYPFVYKFAPLLGLERKDTYTVSNIRDGYYQYLQFWLSYEMRGILSEHAVGEVHVHLDGYVESEPTPHYEAAHEAARGRMDKYDSDPPRHSIHGDNFDQDILEVMIDVLAESSVDKIETPYIIRDVSEEDWDDANSILEFYSDEAILHNIETYYANYAREYETLIANNFPTIEEEISNTRTNFLLVVVDLDNIRRERGEKKGWSINRYWLESDEESQRFEFHLEADEEVANLGNPWKDDALNYDGQNYETYYRGSSGDMLLFDLDRDQRLVFDEVHDELDSELTSYLGKRGVRIRHPARDDV